MTYMEVTGLIGLPDEVRLFEYAQHSSGCLHPKSYSFKPVAGINISNTIQSIYADSLPCCSGMKGTWRNSRPEFIYKNNSYYLHHFNLYLAFSPEGTLSMFSFMDNGFLARTDNGTIFSPNEKLFWNKNTPVYSEEEIEKFIQML